MTKTMVKKAQDKNKELFGKLGHACPRGCTNGPLFASKDEPGKLECPKCEYVFTPLPDGHNERTTPRADARRSTDTRDIAYERRNLPIVEGNVAEPGSKPVPDSEAETPEPKKLPTPSQFRDMTPGERAQTLPPEIASLTPGEYEELTPAERAELAGQ